MSSATTDLALDALEQASGEGSLFRTLCRELVVLLDASGCALSRAIGDLLIEVAEHVPSGRILTTGQGFLISDYPLTQAVMRDGEPQTVLAQDPDADPREVALLSELGFDSLLMLPLRAGEAPWGLVEIYADRPFGPEDALRAEPLVARAGKLLAGPRVT